jgi:hypothetical protein
MRRSATRSGKTYSNNATNKTNQKLKACRKQASFKGATSDAISSADPRVDGMAGSPFDTGHTSPLDPLSIPLKERTFNYAGLPIEIRYKNIHLTFEAQVVGIEFIIPKSRSIRHAAPPRRYTPTPIALRINRESRVEALKFYKLLPSFSIPEK